MKIHKSWLIGKRLGILLFAVTLALSGVVLIGKTAVDNEFVAYENNPVMELGNPGEWDGGIVLPNVVVISDTYHMFYMGMITPFVSAPEIGYATSTDGLTWTKFTSNPVFVADGTGFDAYGVGDPMILFDEGTWILYYGGLPAPPAYLHDYEIGRATAPSPSGPWTRSDVPVLTLGSVDEWDSGFVSPSTVLKTDNGYIMYYSGGMDFLAGGYMIGMATSSDGIIWTKYDDPTTMNAPFAESDPVLIPGASGAWDDRNTWLANVRQTNCGWEMYYSGAEQPPIWNLSIGYAISLDGIHWTKDAANPIFEPADDPVALMTNDQIEAPAVIDVGNERWMYYDYGLGGSPAAIGLAKAPLSCQSTYLPLVMK